MAKRRPVSRVSVIVSIAALAFGTQCWSNSAASAKDFPSQNVQIVVPFTPGATVDATARVIASKLAAQWKYPVTIDNRPGAGSSLGAKLVGQAAPDGHTLLFTIDDTFSVLPHLPTYKSFRPSDDLVPVNILARLVNAIVVNPAVPLNTLSEMIEFARAKPGALRYASAGPGSNSHLAMEVLKSLAKIDIQHIPYRGIAPAMTAALTGEVEITFAGYSAKGLIDTGRLRPIVIAGPDRFAAFPNIPTTVEVGYPRVDSSTRLVLAAPAKTPRETIEAISGAVKLVLESPDVRRDLMDVRGLVIEGLGARDARESLERLIRERGEAVHLSGIDKE